VDRADTVLTCFTNAFGVARLALQEFVKRPLDAIEVHHASAVRKSKSSRTSAPFLRRDRVTT